MTAEPSSSLCQTTAAGRIRMLALATAVALTLAGLGAATSRAAVGSVYFDANNNAAAGDPNALFNATFTGTNNVGLGRSVMENLTTGGGNVAIGHQALLSNTSGSRNTATGGFALNLNTSGDNNVATGFGTMGENTTGEENVATGVSALDSNTTGNNNVATGSSTLDTNTTGSDNVATGFFALVDNTTGTGNVATGSGALLNNTTGKNNVAAGSNALLANTTGNANIAFGQNAGQNLTTGSNNIDIGHPGVAGEAGTIRIGHPSKQAITFIAGIAGSSLGGTTQPVVVNANGRLGVAPARSSSTASLAATVERLIAQNKRQQRQIERLRGQLKGG